jgi:hypothetical protein
MAHLPRFSYPANRNTYSSGDQSSLTPLIYLANVDAHGRDDAAGRLGIHGVCSFRFRVTPLLRSYTSEHGRPIPLADVTRR